VAVELATELLSHRASTDACNAFGQTVLHLACGSGGSAFQPDVAIAIVCALTAEGTAEGSASNSALHAALHAQDNDGMSPLHSLCQRAGRQGGQGGHLESKLAPKFVLVARALLDGGAAVDMMDHGRTTALMLLVSRWVLRSI